MFKLADLEKMATIMGGVLVGRTSANGPAARSGVHEGDIVLTANGVPTPDLPAFVRARKLRSDGVTLELYRYGQRFTLEVTFTAEQPRDVMRAASLGAFERCQ